MNTLRSIATVPQKEVFKPAFIHYYLTACLLFSLFMGYVAFSGYQSNRLLQWKDYQLNEARLMQAELERQYDQAINELEVLRVEMNQTEALRQAQKLQIIQSLEQQRQP